ncbi:MAG: prepilin-type N-terminal cleavage/methylation domain-containing protein [Proteobacteria bacterium]|nr:prepilin-type N-terminal cleavage/methylation domain-containing protein [Pseudomonadota bacterium]
MKSSNQRGFSLTELVISLAVIGVMAAAFTATRSMISSAKVANALQGIETVANGANQYLMTSATNNYSGIGMSVLGTQRLVPTGMTASSANPWGGGYSVSAINSNEDFQVMLTNVPSTISTRLINALSNVATVTYDSASSTVTVRYDKG